MKLHAKYLGIETGGKLVVTMSREDAEEIGIRGGERVKLVSNKSEATAIVNIVTKSVSKGLIGVSDEVWLKLQLSQGALLDVDAEGFPDSLGFIRNKLRGKKLVYEEVYKIVKDVVEGNLSDIEIASFVSALHSQGGPTMDEAYSLTVAMVNTGSQLHFDRKPIVDKHSIGGVPGDKTTLLLVPILASMGITIPKTSSRAITSAAGTADRAETLMPVNLNIEDMKRVVEKTNGCMVWGGTLSLAPADDAFIHVEYPLSIDPLLLPSIMSKKKAVGAEYLVIDIPTGRGTKMKTIGESDLLGKEFIELGRKLNIQTQCVLTYGEQPMGRSIGAGLEAREALEILMRKSQMPDVVDKVAHVAGTLMEMVGIKNGEQTAIDVIRSGKAEKKLREIIYHQGGDSEVKPEDIEIGQYGVDIRAEGKGTVLWIDNGALVSVARAAGSPKDKHSGVIINKKLGESVKKDDVLFTIYSDKTTKLSAAEKEAALNQIYGVADRREMMIHAVKELPKPSPRFILER